MDVDIPLNLFLVVIYLWTRHRKEMTEIMMTENITLGFTEGKSKMHVPTNL